MYQSAVTATSFTVTHDIKTPVWVVEYRCLTLARSFQSYHLNIFSNIRPAGGINIATTGTYSSVIDYTNEAVGQGYNFTAFTAVNGTDYSYNKIISFVSCFGYYGNPGSVPIVDVGFTILNSSFFSYDIVFGSTLNMDRYHFNMIVFDSAQMLNSGLFRMHYTKVNFSDVSGGQLPILEKYKDTAIYGFTDFAATARAKYLTFTLTLGPIMTSVLQCHPQSQSVPQEFNQYNQSAYHYFTFRP